jgi:uncharacterized lipoprotein YddW (UPF0748 family)
MKPRIALILLLFPILALGQSLPKPEFRGVWIATVTNLDWPSSRTASPATQRADLIDLLDKLKAAGTNAVFFQVRAEGDAFYPSAIEPWSTYLTGTEGVAPNPMWDPLAFAIEESHKRGMELHAWLNPYRADRAPGSRTRAANHVTVTNPEWIITATSATSSIKIMNPGLPEVRERVTAVVMDIVRRYDVDGIHFDDYFYPYPPNDMSVGGARDGLDNATFATYGAGKTKGDWRRHNIDIMVKAVHDSIKAAKPHVKFGISPFGIWKNGVPSGIVGMDAYNVIFADAPAWLEDASVDYLTPQLYWKYGGGQDYGKLAPWWAAQTAAKGRHIYQGLAPYRLPPSSGGGSDWAIGDLTSQIRYNQADANTQGQIFFRARSISNNIKAVADTLRQYYFTNATTTPRANWLPVSIPPAPVDFEIEPFVEGGVTKHRLTWKKPSYAASATDTLLMYMIATRAMTVIPTKATPNDQTLSQPLRSVLTGQTVWVDQSPIPFTEYWVYSVGRNGSISAPSVNGVFTSIERDDEIASGIRLEQNYPNPFNPETVIGFQLSGAHMGTPVRLSVYDVLGREVAVLVDGPIPAGSHSVTFDASALSSGVYLYVLSAGDQRVSRTMTLMK